MDLLTIPYDETTGTSSNGWLPTKVVEKFSSLIWVERFQKPGSFTLVTYNIEAFLEEIMPYGYVMHLDLYMGRALFTTTTSNTVMMAEKMMIDQDQQGRERLTLTGRSLDAFLDYRTLHHGPHSERYSPQQPYNPNELALVMMWNAVASPLTSDVIVSGQSRNIKDQIVGLKVGTTLPSDYGTRETLYISNGTVRSELEKLFVDANIGVRSVRPPVTSTSISVNTSGVITRTDVSDDPDVFLETYAGTDRSLQQSVVSPILLRARFGHFESVNNLWDMTSRYSHVSAVSSLGYQEHYNVSNDPNRVGIDRKLMFFDAGGPASGELDANFLASGIQKLSRSALRETEQYFYVDFEVPDGSSLQPNQDYFLGDLISVRTRNYIGEANARVSEIVQSLDKTNGYRIYPGFTTVPE